MRSRVLSLLELIAESAISGFLALVWSLPLVTMPAAFHLAARRLGASVEGRTLPVSESLRAFPAALRSLWLVGAIWAVGTVVVVANLLLIGTGQVPGGSPASVLMTAVGVVLLAWALAGAVVLVPGANPVDMVGATMRAIRIPGLAGTVLLVSVATALLPLLVPPLVVLLPALAVCGIYAATRAYAPFIADLLPRAVAFDDRKASA